MESSLANTAKPAQSLVADTPSADVAALSPELRQLQRTLLQAVTNHDSQQTLLTALGRILSESLNLVALVFCERDDQGPLRTAWRLIPGGVSRHTEQLQAKAVSVSELACGAGRTHIDRFAVGDEFVAMAAPIFHRDRPPAALALVLPATARALDRTLVVVQLVATHLTLWQMLQESLDLEAEAQGNAALVELLGKLESAEDLRQACYALVCELQQYLNCEVVAIGLRSERGRECRLQAVSGTAVFDKHSELTRVYESVFDEAVLRGSLAIWPPPSDAPRHTTLAQQKLASCVGSQSAISGPLFDDRGQPAGAWVFLGSGELADRDAAINLICAAQRPVGCCLRIVKRAEPGPLRRLTRTALDGRRSWRGKAILIGTCVLATILTCPMRYKIRCACEMEAVVRRFVAAPFDGKLQESRVSPGELIAQGDLLARMDGRQIRMELAELTAERGRVVKERDVALAAHDVAAAQLAELDLERLDVNMQMLQRRAEHLEITSPIDGFVISGDHEQLEGAPLTIGQTLFEIAPMETMVAEVAIPEDDVTFVRSGMDVVIRLDACPHREWRGRIGTLHPRSENKDDQNVFVAEVVLDNGEALLQPGMKGRGKILADRYPLGWNLFHKSWDYIACKLGF